MFVSNDAPELLERRMETMTDLTKKVHLEVMPICYPLLLHSP